MSLYSIHRLYWLFNLLLPYHVLYRFSSDTEAELALVHNLCMAAGATAAVVANHWAEGGAGAVDLGKAVIDACAAAKADKATNFK